jgi:hypothetical protein
VRYEGESQWFVCRRAYDGVLVGNWAKGNGSLGVALPMGSG